MATATKKTEVIDVPAKAQTEMIFPGYENVAVTVFTGDRFGVAELVDVPILITSWTWKGSEYSADGEDREYVVAEYVTLDGTRGKFTNGGVIARQIRDHETANGTAPLLCPKGVRFFETAKGEGYALA